MDMMKKNITRKERIRKALNFLVNNVQPSVVAHIPLLLMT